MTAVGRIALPLAAILLAACSERAAPAGEAAAGPAAAATMSASSPQPDAAASGPAATGAQAQAPVPPPVALPVTSLRGEWAVQLENGAVTLYIGQDRIEFDNCQQVAWGYTLDDGRLATQRAAAITIDIHPKPLPCAAPFAPDVDRMVRAIDGARRVDPGANGAIRLTGAGEALLLQPR